MMARSLASRVAASWAHAATSTASSVVSAGASPIDSKSEASAGDRRKRSSISLINFGGDDGGADVLVNKGIVNTLIFTGGADDDILLNLGSVNALTFDGGADDDVLQNEGSDIQTLTFGGGADDDVLLNNGNNIGTLTFEGGADDDVLVSNGQNIGTLNFGGDQGNDTLVLRGSGTGEATSTVIFSGDDGIDAFENNAVNVFRSAFDPNSDSSNSTIALFTSRKRPAGEQLKMPTCNCDKTNSSRETN